MSESAPNLGRAPRKARSIINQMLQSKALTPEGLNWLIAATDPFHDSEIIPSGFPDVSMSRSIVQIVNQTYNIPSPVLGSALWDCHMFLNPVTPSMGAGPEFVAATMATDGLLSAAPQTTQLSSTWNVIAVPAGINWQTDTTGSFTNWPQLILPKSYCAGQWRLLATGLEVVNTTAEIYKQGSVTCYRTPSNPTKGYVYTMPIPPAQQVKTCDFTTLPPSTQPGAALFPNSRTWAASQGIYMIGCFNEMDNPVTFPVPNVAATLPSRSSAMIGASVVGWGTNSSSAMCHTLPFDTTGCIFAGLSAQSTLQVTSRYYIERVPSTGDGDLLLLARPPSPYDPTALELYARAMSSLPVAVPVGENPLGEWFNDVLSAIADWAGPIGTALTPLFPPAGAIGSLVGGAARGVRGLIADEPPPYSVRDPNPTRNTSSSVQFMRATNPQPRKTKKRKRGKRGASKKRIVQLVSTTKRGDLQYKNLYDK